MTKKIRNKFTQEYLNKWYGKIVLIGLIVSIAYFQTLFMYFWNDDNAVVFKLQNLNEGVGNLGSGILGLDSPYRMVIFSLIPIYFLFGINSYAFFAYGILFYFLAAVTVYFFALSFLKDKKLSLLTSLFFASGLVGAESLWRVYNSVHTSIAIIYMLLFSTFYSYFISQKKILKKILFYLVSLVFFVLAIQWGYVRAHGIIIIVLFQEVIFNFSLRWTFIRLAPFIYLSYIWYFAGSSNTKHLSLLISKIFEDYDFNLLLVPINTLKNSLIPDYFNISVVVFLLIMTFLVIKFRSKILFFSIIFIGSGYMTYYMIYHEAVLNTTHRYLIASLPGANLFLVHIFSRIFKTNKQLFIASGIVIVTNLIIINKIQYEILINRSIPTRNFYTQLNQQVPTLQKNSIIYFDVKKETNSLNLFESFFGVGSMPNSTAIAIYYNLDRYDIFLPQTFEELIKTISDKNIKEENIYTFFYSKEEGLKNTTEKLRAALWEDKGEKISSNNAESINYEYSSPLEVEMTVKANIKPYRMSDSKILDLDSYLKYFLDKSDYYRKVSIASDTYWQNYKIEKVIDQDINTSWMGNRGSWHDLHKEDITIDLNQPVKIGAVKIKFSVIDKTATKYSYLCSLDNSTFQDWKIVYFDPKQHGHLKIDLLDEKLCRFIRIKIEETKNGDSPEIAEIEVMKNEFRNLNFNLAEKYENNLTEMLNSPYKNLITEYISKVGLPVALCFITDDFNELTDQSKSRNCQKQSFNLNQNNEVQLIIPQSGTILKKIIILPQKNLNFEIENVQIRELGFNELKDLKFK